MKDIEKLRNEIDSIDNELVRLFKERMEIAKSVAEFKTQNNLPVLDRSREREVLNKVSDLSGGNLSVYTKVLYENIFDLSRSYQLSSMVPETETAIKIERAIKNTPQLFPKRCAVACQGVEGAYSQFACDKLFSLPEIIYCDKFGDVFEAVESGKSKYGIIPLENSTAGSVNEVYSLMHKHRFYIVRSIRIKVNHALVAPKGVKLSDIREIVSHEQAINQSSTFIAGLKGVKVTVFKNTAAAAQYVAQSGRTDVAAIASADCAKLYNLHVLSYSVQNSDNNYTRFICISKNLEIYPGANRTSLMITLPHTPGALYGVLAKFSALEINLNKLESRPIPGSSFEFRFYFDIDASVYSNEFKRIICELENEMEQFTYLGSYTEEM